MCIRDSTRADKLGNWVVIFAALDKGGPLQLIVKGKNTIILNDILIGDVWFCSGQSNMDMNVLSSKNAVEELKDINYPNIRLFTASYEMSERPQPDLKTGKWDVCSEETVKYFSAVGYFFGRKINKDLNVPIGLINSSWGSTNIQCWMSEEGMGEFKNYLPALAELKTKNYEQLTIERDRRQNEWNDSLKNTEPGTLNKWYLPQTNDADWTNLNVPITWEHAGFKGDGVGWFRKEFDLTQEEAANTIIFHLGLIDNADETFLNGEKIGECNVYNVQRIYPAIATTLKKGKNVLAVKVYNYGWDAGFIGQAADMFYQSKSTKKTLAGIWKFKPGYFSPEPAALISPNNYPTLLYNTKVNPFINFAIKGALWYQGENNSQQPEEYRSLLPALIKDWRKKWGIGDFPFLIVQLPNFMPADDQPSDGNWAKFRASQAAALLLPNTAIAVTIDAGEGDDIHPKNKQAVAYRLALAAKKIAYQQNGVFTGPTFKSFSTNSNKAIVDFENKGGGLITLDKYGFVKGFAVAGADHKFYWAKAFIEENKVVVFSDQVAKPIAIRYAWGNNPDVGLYNAENLPAAPFRTDNW
jgi:sialate O-acetylesterase